MICPINIVCFTFIFLQLASELWPESVAVETDEEDDDPDDGGVEVDLEKQIAKEVAFIKRPRREQRFGTLRTLSAWSRSPS